MKRKTYLKNRNYMPGFNRKANVKQLSMAMHIKVFDSATTEHSNYGSAVINRILLLIRLKYFLQRIVLE